ncbi:hypothetical protein MASR1M90_03690 [Desulfovibrionales bacterium]
MMREQFIWNLQKCSGFLAMLFFAATFLALFDGMRTGFLGSGDIRLVPGDHYAVSGPMPPRTEHLPDFVISGVPADGSVRLVPEEIFTGYWFGGSMWRGHIGVEAAQTGSYTITVRDRFGEKQNPALVFTVTVFADHADRQAHSPSLLYRWSGLDAHWFSGGFAAIGIALAGLTYLFGRAWSAVLARHGCGEVFRLKTTDGHYEVGIHMNPRSSMHVGSMLRFAHPVRGELGQGSIIACAGEEITALVPSTTPVRIGDIACPV